MFWIVVVGIIIVIIAVITLEKKDGYKTRQKKYVDIIEYTKRGMAKRVKEMIDSGTDVDERDANGDCAVLWAARYNDLEIMRMLVNAGANLNVKGAGGITPLGYAKINQSEEMIDLISEQ